MDSQNNKVNKENFVKKIMILSALVALVGCADNTGTKHLKIGVNAEYAPYEYLEGNELAGFNVEIVKALLEEAGYTYEFNNMTFDGLIAALQSKKVDVLIGISPTVDRKKVVDFTDNYSVDEQVIIALTNRISTLDINNLQGLKIGVLLGSIQEVVLNTVPSVIPVLYNNYTGAILDLKSEKIDAIILSTLPAKQNIEQNPDIAMLGVVASDISEGFGIALNQNQDELKKDLNDAIKVLQSKGIVDQLKEKYKI